MILVNSDINRAAQQHREARNAPTETNEICGLIPDEGTEAMQWRRDRWANK